MIKKGITRGLLYAVLALLTIAIACVSAASAQERAKRTPNPDAQCLACHSDPTLKSESGRSVYVDPAKHKVGAHGDLTCTTCHTDISDFPHPQRIKRVQCSSCHAEEATDVPASIHSALGPQNCTNCHGSAHDARPAAALGPQMCASCHAGEVKDFLASAHGVAFRKKDPQAPTCQTCHGEVHKISMAQDALSPVAKKNQPQTCGSCHSNSDFLAKHQIPFSHPVESFLSSVHGRALAAGNEKAPSCSDCHTGHAIYAASDVRATVNHWRVPQTCAACHSDIAKTYLASIHGQAVAHRELDSPVCTDCHGDHAILAPSEPGSLVNPARVSLVTCGRCHGDALLVARYNLPADRVPTFADSFHGLASRSGSQTVANCASCHGVHNIFRSNDPRSTVNAANLAHTCGTCHPGAGANFAIGPVHVDTTSANEHPVVKAIRWTYWILIPLVVGFMLFHHFIDFLRKLRANERIGPSGEVSRMNLNFRIAHWFTAISFPVLVITGFALKYPEEWWARPMLGLETHFAFRGTVHRVAAVVLLASLAYHIVHLIVVRRDRAFWREMIPNIGDLHDLFGMVRYNLGFSDARPTFGRFSYVEKIEYLAFLWGTVIMAATGFLLWFNGFTLRHFPGWVSNAATALHFYEAILATLAIVIWHMYTVVFDPDVYPMDRSWITGKTSAEHLHHTRPAYYAEIMQAEQPPSSPSENTDEGEGPESEQPGSHSPTPDAT